jgi:hypothetical protein
VATSSWASSLAGSLTAFLAGNVWGMAFFSWGLPLAIPMRVGVTALLLLALAASSRAGLLAAATFALGTGVSSAVLLAAGGQLFMEWWGLVPGSALLIGVSLLGIGLVHDPRPR